MAPRDNLVLAILVIWCSQYLGARDNYVRAKIWCGENRSENGLELRHQTKTRGLLHGTSLVFFISHFYRAYKYYFFHYKFPMNFQKHSLVFSFMPFCISRIMSAKKNIEIREGSQDQWKHTCTPRDFFSLSLVFSY